MDNIEKKQHKKTFEDKKVLMGIVALKNNQDNIIFLKETMNIEAWINRAKFVLKSGQFEHKIVQKDWNTLGEHVFVFEVVDTLEENDTLYFDYNKELKNMKLAVQERLAQANVVLY